MKKFDKKISLTYIPLYMDKIGNKIREIRARRGIKAQEVAKKLGVLKSTYSAMELGDRKIKADEIGLIAQILGVEVGDLLQGAQTTARERVLTAIGIDLPEQDAQDLEKLCATEEGRAVLGELLQGYIAMTPEKRKALAMLSKTD